MSLNELRLEIDKIDDQLVRLFVQRMEVSAQIADYKKEHHLPIFMPDREAEKLRDVAQKAGKDMDVYAKVLYDLLFELSRGYQSKHNATRTPLFATIHDAICQTPKMLPKEALVACTSTDNPNMDMVCRKMLGQCSQMSFKNQEGILSAVAQGMCQFGLIAVTDSKKRIYDQLAEQGLYIVRSFRLPGLAQYLCVSKQLDIYPGADRTALKMTLSDRPGALYKVLARLYTLGINVLGLESQSVPQQHFQGTFYFDLETSVYSEEFVQLICELDDLCENFAYLGSYTEVV